MVTLNGAQNGIDPQMAQMLALIDQYKPELLHDRITTRDLSLQPLYRRMDGDYGLYTLQPFTGIDNDLYDSEEYLHATDNAPRTFANKVINWFVSAANITRIEMAGRSEELRRIDSAKERLAYGMLNAADKLIKKKGDPGLREEIGEQICIRGPVFARTMLRIDPDTGQTIVEITPWDSRNVVWDTGPKGLAWVAHKMRKTRAQIQREYGVTLEGASDAFNNNDQTGFVVFDYYDDLVNSVFTEDRQILKVPQPHLRPRMPVAYAFGGYSSMMNSGNSSGGDISSGGTVVSESIQHFSESIYESNRETYANTNYMKSIGLHLSALARQPSKKVFSIDGTLTLNEDSDLPGAEIPLSTTAQQDVVNVPPAELTATAVQMLQIFESEKEQGSLSAVNFGNAPFSLSGFAINSLSISAEEKIQPRIRQGNSFYSMALDILMEQYATGMFPILTVTGNDRSGGGFSETIPPEVVQIGGELTVDFMANLPSDEATKIQTALLLRQPGVNGLPLVDDRWIRDNKLGILDVDNMDDRLRGQLAERGSPLAVMWSNIQSAQNEGDDELAFLYGQELQYLLFQMWASARGLLPPPQIPPVGPPEFGSPAFNNAQSAQQRATVPSSVNPPEAIGIQSQPAQQSGPNVPAGSPRPGARVNGGSAVV